MAIFDYNQQPSNMRAATLTANTTSSWVALNGAGHNYTGIPFRVLLQEKVNATGTLDILVELSRDGSTVHATLDGLFKDVSINATTGIGAGGEQTVRIPIRDFTHVRIKVGGTGGSTPATGTWASGLEVVASAGVVLTDTY